MVKSYQRYEQERCFGVIASSSNIVWLPPSASQGKASAGRALTAGLEEILIWDIKTGELLQKMRDGLNPGAADSVTSSAPAEATFLQYHDLTGLVAVGYADGSIKVWDLALGSVLISFTGHKSAVTLLKFDRTGTRLVSGSKDASIIVWDLVGETGLFKLRGHSDQITGVHFLSEHTTDIDEMEEWLVSTSKDGLIKLWDLKTQQCIETHVAHAGECWALAVDTSRNLAITSGRDNQIKVWSLDLAQEATKVAERGEFEKQSTRRAAEISFKEVGAHLFFYVQNADRTMEVFRIRNEDEIAKRIAKKKKDLKKDGYEDAEIDTKVAELDINRLVARITSLSLAALPKSKDKKTSAQKIQAATWTVCNSTKLEILLSTSANSIEYYTIPLPEVISKAQDIVAARQHSVELQGHRKDIRSMDISSDNKLLATASEGMLKVWNVKTTNCIRTFECGYALCTKFLPGGSLIVLGTKHGELQLYDLASSELLHTVEDAHSDEIWSLDLTPDGKALVSGSSDKQVKFWDFKVERELVPGTKDTYVPKMKIVHNKTLELNDAILAVKISPDAKYLAVSLLDNTVKVFFYDTLKFYLSLYGHKLPVLSVDISYDSKMIITSSADKNIKIWGLDFGDCHKSIFGHQDSIMNVKFVANTHNFFSAGKDKLVKYWDGDKFECIQKLPAHQSEIWALAVASDGAFVVSTAHDHSIRIWYETDDQVFLEEEREKEMDELYQNELLESLEGEEPRGDDEADESTKVTKQTMESLKAGEKLMEALELGIKDVEEFEEYASAMQQYNAKKTTMHPMEPVRNAVLQALGVTGSEYVLQTIMKIRAAQLEDALLVLPFSFSLRLLKFIEIWTNKENVSKNLTSMSQICRVLFMVVKHNARELINQKDESIKVQLSNVKEQLRGQLTHSVNELGVNIQGLKYIKAQWNMHHNAEFIDGYEQQQHEEKTAKKRVYQTVA
ncbi:hypothetical protein BABINDRAFT_160662 [Babjeviella inositovora NRRL Y-12698]|uniref:Small-subunit processome Utp12 domain-containing protein n=1 Tax=Babjeviella inositovora NRRL Y-12698 TaxID=984486 RepID=A0A1E3QUE0_9ASCO|nr:uncharacterized protein BABINDRAFT_160662 [Babjeviella inositovora NRRL Y-12698]ODQ81299.1 hypothetical protein BABINDRAFT_160662 [Babjeviella inositovora NRRL Y-12698]